MEFRTGIVIEDEGNLSLSPPPSVIPDAVARTNGTEEAGVLRPIDSCESEESSS
jgi:hypothetical protein